MSVADTIDKASSAARAGAGDCRHWRCGLTLVAGGPAFFGRGGVGMRRAMRRRRARGVWFVRPARETGPARRQAGSEHVGGKVSGGGGGISMSSSLPVAEPAARKFFHCSGSARRVSVWPARRVSRERGGLFAKIAPTDRRA